jgi:hypothetical protein
MKIRSRGPMVIKSAKEIAFPAGTIDQVTFSRSEGIISTAHTVRVSLAIDWRFFFAGIEPYTGFPLRSNPLG